MSDTFGLLELPVPLPADGKAAGDPVLDLLLGFMQAVLNHDLNENGAWSLRSPADPIPVAYTFAHNPDLECFNANATPALYLWRRDGTDNGVFKATQGYIIDDDGIEGLWIPPPMAAEDKKDRETFRNAFKKALRVAFTLGRHPAWVLPGDDYYDAADYGSVLLYHTKLGKCRFGPFRNHTLVLEGYEDRTRQTFECFYFALDTMETWEEDVSKHAPTSAGGTFSLPGRGNHPDRLALLAARYEAGVAALSDDSGVSAGGEALLVYGAQFPIDLDPDVRVTVLFGNELATDVVVENETEISLRTPPHEAGTVDVTVIFPSGVRKTLAGAFTFT
jgi:hypothetical protein